jgi:hypothetical protein
MSSDAADAGNGHEQAMNPAMAITCASAVLAQRRPTIPILSKPSAK